MLSSPLEGHISPAKNVIADRLQWARNSFRKRLDMNGQAMPKAVAELREEGTIKSKPDAGAADRAELLDSGLTNGDKKQSPPASPGGCDPDSSQTSSTSSSASSPERLTLTHGDPLGALDHKEEETPAAVPAQSFFSPSRKPFVLPDLGLRLFTNHRSDEATESSEDETSQSDSEESAESESDSEEESDHSNENIPASDSRLSLR